MTQFSPASCPNPWLASIEVGIYDVIKTKPTNEEYTKRGQVLENFKIVR